MKFLSVLAPQTPKAPFQEVGAVVGADPACLAGYTVLGLSSRVPLPVTKSGTARKFDALASFPCTLFTRALLDLELFASLCLLPHSPPGSQPCPYLARHPNSAKNDPTISKHQALVHLFPTWEEEEKGLGKF